VIPRPSRSTLLRLLLTLAVTSAGAMAQTAVYLDPSQPLELRVNDLVSRMTLEEKISQLVNQSREIARLQVPTYDWWSEALCTASPDPASLRCFPSRSVSPQRLTLP
jgi:beta-glucosidase